MEGVKRSIRYMALYAQKYYLYSLAFGLGFTVYFCFLDEHNFSLDSIATILPEMVLFGGALFIVAHQMYWTQMGQQTQISMSATRQETWLGMVTYNLLIVLEVFLTIVILKGIFSSYLGGTHNLSMDFVILCGAVTIGQLLGMLTLALGRKGYIIAIAVIAIGSGFLSGFAFATSGEGFIVFNAVISWIVMALGVILFMATMVLTKYLTRRVEVRTI